MKTLAAIALLGFLLSSEVFAAEVTYTADMRGIECADCKRTISRAIGKIRGVKTILISKESEEKHRLTVVTDGTQDISKADATAALGKDSHYEIFTWNVVR